MISRHQGKLLKGFFTRNAAVHPEIKTCNKNCKNCSLKKNPQKQILSLQKNN